MKKNKQSRQQRTKPSISEPEQNGMNPRQALFETFYQEGGPNFRPGNAYRSAIAAGYTPITAKANCHVLARRCKIKTAEALQAMGCDGFTQAAKLIQLQKARLVKWNPEKFPARTLTKPNTKTKTEIAAHGGWDTFDDGDLQLRVTQEINRLLDAYPAPKEPGDSTRPIQLIFPASFSSLTVKAKEA